MSYPINSKLAATFTLEGSPGSSNNTRSIIFSYNNFAGVKLVLDNPITSTEINTNDNESFRSIYYKLMKILDNNILYSTENNEQMLIRTVKSISFYNPLSYPNMVNSDSGYYPYDITILLNRGYNGTTPQAQNGYASGYFSNVYCLENTYNPSVINPLLSGTVNNLFYGNNQIDLYFTNYGIGSNLYDYILDRDNFKLRLNMGNDYITSTEMSLIKNGQNYDSLKTRFNNIFSGKVLKVYISEIDAYEEILINSIESFHVSDETKTCPNDLGYMPNRVRLNVTRAYNGTSIITGSYTSSIGIVKESGSQTYNNYVINAYVEGTNIIEDDLTDNIYMNEDLKTTNGFIELLSETLLLNNQLIGNDEILVFLQDYLLLPQNIELFNNKTVLVILNDLLALHENYNQEIDVKLIFNEVLKFIDDFGYINLEEVLLILTEVLKFNSSETTFINVGKIIELILSEYFIFTESSNFSKELLLKLQQFMVLNNETVTNKISLISFNDNLQITEQLRQNQITQESFEEILRTTTMLILDNEVYECYSLFLENGAITRYDNYNFNSYCNFNNNYYATSKNMLVKLFDNDDNDESDFNATFKTGLINAGNDEDQTTHNNNLRNKQKSIQFGTFTLTSKGQVLFSIINDRQEKFTYNLVYKETDGKIEQTFGSKVRGNYFELELTTNDDLELQDFILYPTILNKYNK